MNRTAAGVLAPMVRRQVVDKAWGRYCGVDLTATWRQYERSQWFSVESLRETQGQNLHRLVTFVATHNTFYRDRFARAGVDVDRIRTVDDLRQLPILTKKDVREAGRGLMSDGFDPSQLQQAKTGGSTGKPIELFFTEEMSYRRNMLGWRHKRWAGWELGEPMGACWGNPVYPETLKDRLRVWLLSPTIYLDTMSVNPESVTIFADQWARNQPSLLFGHAHSVYTLAAMVDQLGLTTIRPRGIITSSMMLIPHERALIERIFGVRVTDLYGSEETGLIASECDRHEGLHLNMDQLIVEVIRDDGTPVAPGEPGLVVVTDLQNLAMPFVRYRLEDMAELSGAPCSCGRAMPLLSRVVGRTADFLRRTDGSRVAGISLIENTLTKIPGFEQMQIVQEDLHNITIRIVPGSEIAAANRAELTHYFADTFPGATITVEDVTAIPPEPNGKYRFSICRIAD